MYFESQADEPLSCGKWKPEKGLNGSIMFNTGSQNLDLCQSTTW